MVEIALEDYKVRLREVQEEIGSFAVQVPVGVACAPEGMLLVDPLALLLVLLR